jgi:ADP-ribosyl-[dinitrogen reductase] hydrolase
LVAKPNCRHFWKPTLPANGQVRTRGKVGPDGLAAVRAAITALMAETSMSGLLRRCVDFGGDVDTVAAVALGAASCSPDYAQDLPTALHDGLENGPWGKDYLRELDSRLLSLTAT